MRLGDISLHFHLLYDPGTNNCSTLGYSFSFYIMGRKGHCSLLGIAGLSIALVTRDTLWWDGEQGQAFPRNPTSLTKAL